ncbi:PrgI family protein [Actinomadura darangshiensis]|uniref:PrgI family protein n=1 Tax=Actinomadura darangshiensis TaxID=705336 RepID=A0A4R4ZUC7_9ACTN|nr:PrgI family protein [Actinomadura darangshiensis]
MPADVERDDRVLANLTVRQLAILIPAVAAVWLGLVGTDSLVPLPVFAVIAVAVLGAAAALALGERDGVGLDRLLIYALAQRSRPRRLVVAPEGVPALPGWAIAGPPHGNAPALPAPLKLPVHAIRADGVIDLGPDGVAAFVACSTVSFALRTPGEQAGLVGAFASWLNSLSGPAQILVHAQPVNLHPAIGGLREQAAGLPHPALEEAAIDHAAFLSELAATRELLARQVLVVLREPYGPPANSSIGPSPGTSGAGDRGRDVGGAATRVLRRAEQTARALAAAGINARVLAADEAAAVLGQAADPTAPPMDPGTAPPGQTITANSAITTPDDQHGRAGTTEAGR